MIVLDTNVLSELMRSEPDAAVLGWIRSQRRSKLCTTAITEAELAYGLAAIPKGRRCEALDQALSRLVGEGLGGRVLPFDRAAARAYADFAAKRRAAGRPVAMAYTQIAAIARSCGAEALATRNTPDFTNCGVRLLNPWNTGSAA